MPEQPVSSSKRVLDPVERIAEVLFGLIMVLAFTGSLSAATLGRSEIRTMLFGALACNLAWGIIDGVFYLMGCLAQRSQRLRILHSVHKTADPQEAQRLIAESLPPLVASVMQPAELETIHERLNQLPEPPAQARLRGADYLGRLGVFLLVFLSTFPVVIPFLLMRHAWWALRLSNFIAIVMLFFTGAAFGRCTGRKPWAMGVIMVLVGAAMVGLTMALGG
jgi:hypothetical protein